MLISKLYFRNVKHLGKDNHLLLSLKTDALLGILRCNCTILSAHLPTSLFPHRGFNEVMEMANLCINSYVFKLPELLGLIKVTNIKPRS